MCGDMSEFITDSNLEQRGSGTTAAIQLKLGVEAVGDRLYNYSATQYRYRNPFEVTLEEIVDMDFNEFQDFLNALRIMQEAKIGT